MLSWFGVDHGLLAKPLDGVPASDMRAATAGMLDILELCLLRGQATIDATVVTAWKAGGELQFLTKELADAVDGFALETVRNEQDARGLHSASSSPRRG
ncbi:hypothetical protein DSM104299_00243 [Baekduia alba]|uniref:hypothetical protein n=1 Tax=Baekduia alba TaxID=2997333 RepID=UPI002340DDA7|nr:hypothetical protein [Baekduia alba]WCB91572.1 hypothetical protein DSM104299_00243 [Baekduia alba]